MRQLKPNIEALRQALLSNEHWLAHLRAMHHHASSLPFPDKRKLERIELAISRRGYHAAAWQASLNAALPERAARTSRVYTEKLAKQSAKRARRAARRP